MPRKAPGADWITVHLPRYIADMVGATSRAHGVTKHQAIGAALWVFSQLTMEDRARIINQHLLEEASAGLPTAQYTAHIRG